METATQLPQHLDALGRANRIRSYRAEVKRDLRSGLRGLSTDLLEDPDLAGMTIGELLRSLPQWGHVRTRRTLARLMISPAARLRELTPRQQLVVVSAVPR